MTSATGPGGCVAAASSAAKSTEAAFTAFDKSRYSRWRSSNTYYGGVHTKTVRTTVEGMGDPLAGEWLQLELPTPVLLSSYALRPATPTRSPADFTVAGSNDGGATWALVDGREGQTYGSSASVKSFSCNPAEAYVLYRIITTLITDTSYIKTGVQIAEWTLTGVSLPPPEPLSGLSVGGLSGLAAQKLAAQAAAGGAPGPKAAPSKKSPPKSPSNNTVGSEQAADYEAADYAPAAAPPPGPPVNPDAIASGSAVFVVCSLGVQVETSATNASGAAAPVTADVAKQIAAAAAVLQKALLPKASTGLQPLWNTLTWTAVAFVALSGLHVILRAVLVWRGKRMWGVLAYPKLEILLAKTLLPIVAAGAAGANADGRCSALGPRPAWRGTPCRRLCGALQASCADSLASLRPPRPPPSAGFLSQGPTPTERAVGAFFAIVLPLVLMGLATWLIVMHISLVGKANVVYILDADAAKEAAAQEADAAAAAAAAAAEPAADPAADPAPGTDEALVGAAGATSASLDPEMQSEGSAEGASTSEDGGRAAPLLPAAAAAAAPKPRQPWYVRYILRPVFGWNPAEAGTWVDTRPGSPFVSRYGLLFQDMKGPKMRQVPEPGAERARLEPAAASRRLRAREIAQLLGGVVATLRAVLFADVLAGMAGGVNPLVPVVLLLALSVLYVVYMRLLAPPLTVVDLVTEMVVMLFEMASFAAGIVVAVTPPSDIVTS
jgi:hypothetical protein